MAGGWVHVRMWHMVDNWYSTTTLVMSSIELGAAKLGEFGWALQRMHKSTMSKEGDSKA